MIELRRDKGCEGGLQASSEQFFVARFLLGLASFRQCHKSTQTTKVRLIKITATTNVKSQI